MGAIEQLTAWFARHHTTRKFVKGTILATLGVVAAMNLEIVGAVETQLQSGFPAYLPVWMLVKPSIIGAFIALANWLQHSPVLPIVGAKNKKKK